MNDLQTSSAPTGSVGFRRLQDTSSLWWLGVILIVLGSLGNNLGTVKPMDEKTLERRTINLDDVRLVISNIAKLATTPGALEDDIDHLGSRRVRFVGELLQQKIRVGMAQIKRNIQDRNISSPLA